jgi:hypothetical protein
VVATGLADSEDPELHALTTSVDIAKAKKIAFGSCTLIFYFPSICLKAGRASRHIESNEPVLETS